MKSTNIPEVRLGIIAVSRDCFPSSSARSGAVPSKPLVMPRS